MRKILFRGKRIDNGEWVEGYYSKLDADEFDDAVHMILNKTLQRCYVDPATVGQYTGLTDKNGTRIFEGDVLRYNDGDEYDENERYVVVWMEAGFWLEYHNGKTNSGYEPDWADSYSFFEIIGNIHDNPELMEGRAGEDG